MSSQAIVVRRQAMNSAMPPEEIWFPDGTAEEAITYARRISHHHGVYSVQVADLNGLQYAWFSGSWAYEPPPVRSSHEPASAG